MPLMEFAQRAIGVPFVAGGRDFGGWDCWGLIVCAYKFCWNINLPTYKDAPPLDFAMVSSLVDEELVNWVETTDPTPGDVILLRNGLLPSHVGLIFSKGRMLHVEKGIETCIENYTSLIWKNRVVGIFKYAKSSTS